MTEQVITMRRATVADSENIEALIETSARALCRGDYANDVIDAALGTVWGLDRQLIADGTYFVAEDRTQLAACGGWSRRRTLFGADGIDDRDDSALEPSTDAARIRA